MPALQLPLAHACPHEPQFAGSLLVLRQPEEHCVLPALHGYEQLVPLHDGVVFAGAPALQLVQLGPHAFVSLSKNTYTLASSNSS